MIPPIKRNFNSVRDAGKAYDINEIESCILLCIQQDFFVRRESWKNENSLMNKR